MVLSVKQAKELTGGLSNTSKMPGYSWSISAKRCNVGSKLRKIKNSTCSSCYALKGRYIFQNVVDAHERRYARSKEDTWVPAMIFLINRRCEKVPFFRWFDAGDLQSLQMLKDIISICEGTPNVRHWLPTREKALVIRFVTEGGVIPSNLNIRISAPFVDSEKGGIKVVGCTRSTVSTAKENIPNASHCPAPKQDNACKDCRACWDKTKEVVDYHVH